MGWKGNNMSLIPLFLNYKTNALFFGIFFGLANGISPGPTLTMVISQTLQYNFKEGIKIACSPLIYGVIIIPLSLLLFSKLSPINLYMEIISLIGAIYLSYLGYQLIRSPQTDIYKKNEAASLKKGILANFVSPYAYLFWFTVGTPLLIQFFTVSAVHAILFIIFYYLLLIGSKIFIAYLAEKSKKFFNQVYFTYILKFLGCMYIFFAFL